MQKKYDHRKIEKKWQEKWEKEQLYVADIDNGKKPFYNLWMFPYPSAEGLHAGHAFASTGSDIIGRYMRMQGREVFQPIGYDSFGIHSENYAIKINQNPHEVVRRTTSHYEEQMRSLGHGYDWTRTVTTSDPDYYKWTQWLFVKLFENGLAYKKKATVNFCPSCKTVLADEQVMSPKTAGKDPKNAKGEVVPSSDDLKVCERCGTIVEKKELDQWFMRITDYAERLLSGLTKIDWSERVKLAQKEWIGKKEGVVVHHKLKDGDLILDSFSAYPAWLFADTFLVMAPEHPIVSDLVSGTKYQNDVEKFVEDFKQNKTNKASKLDEKEGIFTGRYAIDPFSGREMPIWLANFALMDFGTGIIRCSAHDVRDYEFATKYKIPLKEVVDRTDPNLPVNAHGNVGVLKDSGPFSGRDISPSLIEEMLDWIVKEKIGERNTTYHLRDWLVSRQRYWGAPIPMIHCKNCEEKGEGYLTFKGESFKGQLHTDHSDWDYFGWWPEENLPVTLPPMKEYKPEGTGKGPLSHHPEFYEVKCPHCGRPAERETDVMDTFVDSSWYFLRYPSVKAKTATKLPFDLVISDKWLPVNLYFGGAEHSVLHLMYARFVNMVMNDLKLVKTEEPFPKFFAHGLMIKDGAKMSKSRGNVVNPDEYVNKFGADALRLYLAFMGPMDSSPDFRDSGMEGAARFLGRVWRLFQEKPKEKVSPEVLTKLHQTIKKIGGDIEEYKFNTAISGLMEFVNTLYEYGTDKESLKTLALLLAPFAPHMTEELWVEYLHMPFSVHKASWPKYEAKYTSKSEATIVIQINGKLRSQLAISNLQLTKEEITEMAKKDEKSAKWLEGKAIKKTIFVPGKLINFVI